MRTYQLNPLLFLQQGISIFQHAQDSKCWIVEDRTLLALEIFPPVNTNMKRIRIYHHKIIKMEDYDNFIPLQV